MTISMHSASVPVLLKVLGNLLTWLDKAQAHADARKFDSKNYLGMRLAPDMLPMSRQVQITSDTAKACVARLTGVEIPAWPDDEASLDDLRARVNKTMDFVRAADAAAFEGADAREVVVPRRTSEPLRFDGETFLKHYALPNLFFHATMTYALLRHAGVELGKADFLGR